MRAQVTFTNRSQVAAADTRAPPLCRGASKSNGAPWSSFAQSVAASDGEETYLDEPAEDVAAKIDALDQYSCFSVFLAAFSASLCALKNGSARLGPR